MKFQVTMELCGLMSLVLKEKMLKDLATTMQMRGKVL